MEMITNFGLKAEGTEEELAEIRKALGYGKFNSKGVINVEGEECYSTPGDIVDLAMKIDTVSGDARFTIRGRMDDGGEYINFDISKSDNKIYIKMSDWLEHEYDEDDYEEPENDEDEWGAFDWFRQDVFNDVEWVDEDEIDVSPEKMAKFVGVIAGFSDDDLGKVLMSYFTVDLEMTDLKVETNRKFTTGELGVCQFEIIRYAITKIEADHFAEELSIVLPNSKITLYAVLNSEEAMFTYSYEGGKLTCERIVSEKGDTQSDSITWMTEEEKTEFLESMEEDDWDEE